LTLTSPYVRIRPAGAAEIAPRRWAAGKERSIDRVLIPFNESIDLGAYQPRASDLGDEVNSMAVPSSYVPDIVGSIRRAAADPLTKLIHVDLGDGHQWWHTRLYLVAALAEDYARIETLVFHADRGGVSHCFVGTARPSATRLALAAVTPALQLAYSAGQNDASAQPRPIALHSADAAEVVIAGFVRHLPDEEETIEIDVTEPLLLRWLGPDLVTDSLPAPANPGAAVPRRDLPAILARPEPYVALTRGQHLVQVVDRAELASRLALAAVSQLG
jgi:hypothetical protein